MSDTQPKLTPDQIAAVRAAVEDLLRRVRGRIATLSPALQFEAVRTLAVVEQEAANTP